MTNQLIYSTHSEHLVAGINGEQLSVEYKVFRTYPTVNAHLYGLSVPTKVTAFRLKLVLSKVEDGTSATILGLDMGDITPSSGEIAYLVNSLARRQDLHIFEVTTAIKHVQKSQKEVFKKNAIKELKREIGFYKVQQHEERRRLVKEAARLCNSL